MKKSAVLFSGGKDSVYSAYLAKQKGYELKCLISIFSKNKYSYMFHTPSISKVKKQAKMMNIPLIIKKTKGEKEIELKDLEKAIKKAIKKYQINTIITGAIESNYQLVRIKKICEKFNLNSLNPLWKINQIDYLNELIKNDFDVIITGFSAYPLNKSWLGKKIDKNFIEQIKKYDLSPAGEGGEFETFVVNCPLFKKSLKIKNFRDTFDGENSGIREIKI
jgi:diphthine-ammonia ligase